jgi:hypothetical protein
MAEQVEKSEASKKAEDALERHEAAKDKMKELEEQDEPPKDLKDWPDDESKYLTYGGGEGDHGYDEGPERKLGPSSLEHREDGSIAIEGEEVDNPDDYKGDPIPGGPSDPDAPAIAGEDEDDTKGSGPEGSDA